MRRPPGAATEPTSPPTSTPTPEEGRLVWLWPFQVLVEEVERADAVDLVRSVEHFQLGRIADLELVIQPLDLGELVVDALVGGDAVAVAALDHEGPRRDQPGHLGVVERVGEIPLEDLVLAGGYVAVGAVDRRILPDPLVEVGGADREAVPL